MGAITFTSKLILGIVLSVLVGVGYSFYRKQNQPDRMGGPISRAKIFWLFYALTSWFLLSPLLAYDVEVPSFLRAIFGVFSLLMWGRGVVEAIMLYKTKNWTPPLGIAHDLFCLVVLLFCFGVYFQDFLTLQTLPWTHPTWWFSSFLGILILSLGCETYYAWSFYCLVENTKGEDGIWFASAEDPRFRRINQITCFWNVIFYGHLVCFLMFLFFYS